MKTKLSVLLAAILLATGLVGCGTSQANIDTQNGSLEAMYVATNKEAPTTAEPKLAAKAIYAQIEQEQGRYDAKELSFAELTELTGISGQNAIEVVAYRSNPKSGLCDVIIVRPYPSLREEVRVKLQNYRETRVREFENFDILDAYSIAENAVVYDQGEFLVLLMLQDNDSAQEQIDLYIPQ